jgi:hypothetical protein
VTEIFLICSYEFASLRYCGHDRGYRASPKIGCTTPTLSEPLYFEGKMTMQTLRLVKPALAFLPAYVAALERGWSPDNLRQAEASGEELDVIRKSLTDFSCAA